VRFAGSDFGGVNWDWADVDVAPTASASAKRQRVKTRRYCADDVFFGMQECYSRATIWAT
jgi:hypothetical protein